MRILEVKQILENSEKIVFQLPNGTFVPSHFHFTEVGKVAKHFVDCGGTERTELKANFQLWSANDYDHRLHPEKLLKILDISEKTLNLGNLEIEVEYQGDTIEKYGLDYNGEHFVLTTKQTDCLAKDNCGIPVNKESKPLSELQNSSSGCCSPESGCC